MFRQLLEVKAQKIFHQHFESALRDPEFQAHSFNLNKYLKSINFCTRKTKVVFCNLKQRGFFCFEDKYI